MQQRREIDYAALIDRSIKDFQPVKRLWPVALRLDLWILFEAATLALSVGLRGFGEVAGPIRNPTEFAGFSIFILTSIAAAFLALRSSIPGREVSTFELLLLIAALWLAFAIGFEPLAHPGLSRDLLWPELSSMAQALGLLAPPWLALFYAARRGVPLQPARTGGLIGVAAFCCALAGLHFIAPSGAFASPIIWQVLLGVVVTAISMVAGAFWLNPVPQWRQHRDTSSRAEKRTWISFNAVSAFPLAIAISIVALVVVMDITTQNLVLVPDFDLAIENYQQSLTAFRSNVPSSSIEAVLTAYVEHGMPSYMWDFSHEGFKLVGGRWEHLPDGTPVTYTWFRGTKGGIICMFRQTDGFNPPPIPHLEHHDLLFYRYRGFSVCLINVGGYGNFISVIVAAIPMQKFVPLVLAAAS